MSWSSTAQSICPVTIGVSTASQAAASAPARSGTPTGPPPPCGSRTSSTTAGAAQVVQVDVHGQVRRLPSRPGSSARRSAACTPPPSHHVALPRGAVSSGPPSPQRVQHHRQRRRARRGQVPLQPPGPPERGTQPQRASSNPSLSRSGWSGAVEHLPRQPRQIMLIRAAQHRRQQNPVRVRPVPSGSLSVQSQISRPARPELPLRQRARSPVAPAAAHRPPPRRRLCDAGDRAQPDGPVYPSASYPCWR